MTRFIIFLGIIILAVSCADKEIPRTDLTFNRVVAADLFTRFPGTLRVTSKHILLQNPFDSNAFLQVYDRKTGRIVLSTGKIGRAPGEWSMPGISNVINNRVAVYDGGLKQFTFMEVDTVMPNISNTDSIRKIDTDIDRLAFRNQSQYIAATWKETHPFEIFSNGQFFPCGQYSVKETVKNTIDRFQGNIQIHPTRDLFVYATFENPYIALYQIEKDDLKLMWENQFKPAQYSVTDGELRWGTEQSDGVSDVAFTKDYIVCLVKDFKSEAQGRDIEAAPKASYIFDYDGQLIRIFDLPAHSIRLAADTETNMFYSVALEPDYRIVEYDLSSVGL